MRIIRVPVFHRGALWLLVQGAVWGQRCLRYRGACWEPLVTGRNCSIYRRAPDALACFREQVEDYEFMFYRGLLQGAFGRDSILRARTRLWRSADGAYRALSSAVGGAYAD